MSWLFSDMFSEHENKNNLKPFYLVCNWRSKTLSHVMYLKYNSPKWKNNVNRTKVNTDFKIVKNTFFNKLSNFINSSSGNVLKVKTF